VSTERQQALDFIRAHWPTLAAVAWRFHLHYGRGAVIVDWRLLERWQGSSYDLRVHPYYTAEPQDPDLVAMIEEYDPATSVVIAFSRKLDDAPLPGLELSPEKPIPLGSGAAFAAMTVTAVPSPPEAHRASGH
jgi:hypothetical protein